MFMHSKISFVKEINLVKVVAAHVWRSQSHHAALRREEVSESKHFSQNCECVCVCVTSLSLTALTLSVKILATFDIKQPFCFLSRAQNRLSRFLLSQLVLPFSDTTISSVCPVVVTHEHSVKAAHTRRVALPSVLYFICWSM